MKKILIFATVTMLFTMCVSDKDELSVLPDDETTASQPQLTRAKSGCCDAVFIVHTCSGGFYYNPQDAACDFPTNISGGSEKYCECSACQRKYGMTPWSSLTSGSGTVSQQVFSTGKVVASLKLTGSGPRNPHLLTVTCNGVSNEEMIEDDVTMYKFFNNVPLGNVWVSFENSLGGKFVFGGNETSDFV